ncbi:MAG: tRNA pseudouridine(55) synthase TruB [Rhodanobacteraceae bacterium]
MPRNESRVPSPESRTIHGLLLLDKPLGDSSNRALQRVKRLFRARKAGHTGSLDPLATGMLPVCLGEATKIAGLLLGAHKAYVAEAQLGVTTTTGDAEGEVVAHTEVPVLDHAMVERAMEAFRGRIRQVPPVYSALKQGGVPLYKRARRGEEVSAPPREVDIFRFELLELSADRLRVEVECGSGTYIRSLMADLGQALACGAHLTSLRRTWVDPFKGARMYTLEELEAMAGNDDANVLDACLLPVEAGLSGMPAIRLDSADSLAVAQGRPVDVAASGLCRVYADDGRLLALGEPDAQGHLVVRRGFNLPAPA